MVSSELFGEAVLLQKNRLRAAFEATDYVVHGPGESPWIIRVGKVHPAMDEWLRCSGHACWAWLTAVNPCSRRWPEADNRVRLQALHEELQGQLWWIGYAVAHAQDWPDEESVWVPGLATARAQAIARQFGQVAFLVGELDAPARLVWTSDPTD